MGTAVVNSVGNWSNLVHNMMYTSVHGTDVKSFRRDHIWVHTWKCGHYLVLRFMIVSASHDDEIKPPLQVICIGIVGLPTRPYLVQM